MTGSTKLQEYINWLDSSVKFDSPMTKNSLEKIRDALIEIQKTYYSKDELFAKKTDFFMDNSLWASRVGPAQANNLVQKDLFQ